MKRKAILIESSNVPGENDLPGARIDIENWVTFLKSDLGGAWSGSEITVLRKPFSKEVKEALDAASDAYCFVAFSGHGRDGSVVLNEHYTAFPIIDLKPKGERGTLIVDSCRGSQDAERFYFGGSTVISVANEAIGESAALNASQGGITTFSRQNVVKKSSELNYHLFHWMNEMQNSSKGIVQMLSCAKGQAAGENPRSGGHYTSLLMKSADVWNRVYSGSKIHSTKDAHDYAAKLLPAQQTPEYSPSYLKFPFAVKA